MRQAKDGLRDSSTPVWGDSPVVATVAVDRRYDPRNAQVVLSQLQALLAPPPPIAMRDAVARYIDEHADTAWKPATVYLRRLHFGYLCEWFGNRNLAEVGQAEAVTVYRKMPRSSASQIVCAIRALLKWAKKRGLIANDCDIDPKLASVYSKPRTTVVLGDDALRLLDAFDELDARDFPRDRLKSATQCLRFLLGTGLRLDEARCLTWDRIASDCSSLYLDDSKTGPRHVVLGSSVRAMLGALRQSRTCAYVFVGRDGRSCVGKRTVQVAMREAAALAGLHGVVVHTTRHSAATRAIQLGIHTRVIQEALGWKTARELGRYAHVAANDVRAAMDAVSLVVKDGAK